MIQDMSGKPHQEERPPIICNCLRCFCGGVSEILGLLRDAREQLVYCETQFFDQQQFDKGSKLHNIISRITGVLDANKRA